MIPCVKCGSLEKLKDGKCKPCKKVRMAKWRAANTEKIRAQQRANYEATKYHQLAVQKARRARNPELFKARVKDWVDRNGARMTELRRRWKAENRARVCAYSQARRARLASVGGRLTEGDVKRLLVLQKRRCAVCRTSIRKKFHADHVVPLAKGGDNSMLNMQLLCPRCNLQKGAKHPVDFMRSKGFLL